MLVLSNAILGYGKKPILSVASLAVQTREHCLLTGASGSGKTTLLYTVAGILPVISGSISCAGTELGQLSERKRDRFRGRHLGIIFQTLHLVKSLSVVENLMLAFYAAGLPQDKACALALLDRLGIADKKDSLPGRLSQGQAQRVAIARAVLCRPQLILADEPTSSLDDDSCGKVIGLILEVAQEAGAALLISTHDARVKPYFSRVVQLGNAS